MNHHATSEPQSSEWPAITVTARRPSQLGASKPWTAPARMACCACCVLCTVWEDQAPNRSLAAGRCASERRLGARAIREGMPAETRTRLRWYLTPGGHVGVRCGEGMREHENGLAV